MTFQHLLDGAEVLAQNGDPSVSSVEYDSRRVKPGTVFVAMHGETSDGNLFIDQAIQAGAVAVVTDSPAEKAREGVAWAVVPHGRRALARISANFYKRPAERIAITGITGTNGKSTTAFLIESILTAAGRKSALIGTIEYHVAAKSIPRRTPRRKRSNWLAFSTKRWVWARPMPSWKFHRMPWRRNACSACPSTSPSSPT